ncbi:sphingolipid C9-methyltransferase [Armillaria mellea]|nr:sphingolipid C9-methyltransferase [Armillaria mellea]
MPSVKESSFAAIKNAPLVGLAEGNSYFSNYHLAAVVLVVPYILKSILPLASHRPVAYWTLASMYGARKNQKVTLPGKDIEEYIEIKDAELSKLYKGKDKIPMQVFHDAYFDGKVEFKGDVLDILEQRHDWAKFTFTPELFKHVFTKLIPDVISHSREQDQDQVQDHYDRGDDFYGWFLGPRMIYTSGIVLDANAEETLEQLQDNKLAVVCNKLDLKPTDRLLDIGCGWGTLTAYAAKNFGCDATGVTLAKNQAKFGNDRIAKNGISNDKARILNRDYRDIPQVPGSFDKIVCLEMAEHVGIRRYSQFLSETMAFMVFQVAGFRPCWQFEDLNWGLFMNKYVFPGADASCSLGWVIQKLEGVGFEIKNIDVLGVHYSATLYRWYLNWVSNKDKVIAAYGDKWYRTWVVFLAWSTITSRQGSASVFQITVHKNLNAYHRIAGVANHASIHVKLEKEPMYNGKLWSIDACNRETLPL